MSGRRGNHPDSGNFTISGNLANVSIANGENAHAVNQVSRSPVDSGVLSEADRSLARRELELLRAELAAMRPGALPAGVVETAARDVEVLREQIELDRPDRGETAHRLAALVAVLGGVAGLAETVHRLREALGQLLGLE